MSVASFRERFSDSRSCWVVFIHVVRGRYGGLLRFSERKLLRSTWRLIHLVCWLIKMCVMCYCAYTAFQLCFTWQEQQFEMLIIIAAVYLTLSPSFLCLTDAPLSSSRPSTRTYRQPSSRQPSRHSRAGQPQRQQAESPVC